MNYTPVVLLKHFPLWHFLCDREIKTFMLRISKGHFFFFFNLKGLWLTLFKKQIPPPFMGIQTLGSSEREPLSKLS